MPNSRLRTVALLCLLCLPLVLATGCSKTNGGQAAPPPQVDVARPVVMSMREHEEFTGRIQPINSVIMQSRVSGFLDIVCVGRKNGEDANPQEGMRLIPEGSDVKKGEVLFVIEKKPFKIALAQAQKTLEQNKAQRDYNKRNYDRNVKAGPGVTQSDVDLAYAAWQTSEAQVGQAEAALRNAQENLDWATVRAPFDGRIGKRLIDRGNVVRAEMTNLCTIEQVDPLYAVFDVDERTFMRLELYEGMIPTQADTARQSPVGGGALFQAGSSPAQAEAGKQYPLELALANEPTFSHSGTIQFADNHLDPGTGTLRMWGLFDNTDHVLKSGMFVRVRMGFGEPRQMYFVDERAINSDQGRKYLYVVVDEDKDGQTAPRIDRRDVEVQQRKDGWIAVLPLKEGGLTANDRVVVTNLQNLRKGIEVEPTLLPKMPSMAVNNDPKPLKPHSPPSH